MRRRTLSEYKKLGVGFNHFCEVLNLKNGNLENVILTIKECYIALRSNQCVFRTEQHFLDCCSIKTLTKSSASMQNEQQILVSASKTAYCIGKQDWIWFQTELQPCSELWDTWALSLSTNILSQRNMHPLTVSSVHPEGGHYLWCGMFRCQRLMIHNSLCTVFCCKWTLLFNINTLDISQSRV